MISYLFCVSEICRGGCLHPPVDLVYVELRLLHKCLQEAIVRLEMDVI